MYQSSPAASPEVGAHDHPVARVDELFGGRLDLFPGVLPALEVRSNRRAATRGPLLDRIDDHVGVEVRSTIVEVAATVYPDSDKIGIWTGNRDDDVIVRRASKVDYFDGEPPRGDT